MDEIFGTGKNAAGSEPFLIATIYNTGSSGTIIKFADGTNSLARYKRVVTGETLSAGDRVIVASVSGSYVILGKIAN